MTRIRLLKPVGRIIKVNVRIGALLLCARYAKKAAVGLLTVSVEVTSVSLHPIVSLTISSML